jgi:hypothetical protein
MVFFQSFLHYFVFRRQAVGEKGGAAAFLTGFFCAACTNLRKTLCQIDFHQAAIYNGA